MLQKMNTKKLKKIIEDTYPEINLKNMGMSKLSIEKEPNVYLKDIIEKNVPEKYYLKNKVVEKIIKTREFNEKFTCLKTKKTSSN